MKKRLFLVNYKFTTAGREYSEYKLVTIKYEGIMDQEWGLRLAEDQVAALFEGTESELNSVVASAAIEKVYTQPLTARNFKKTNGIDAPFGWFTSKVNPFVDPDLSDPKDGLISDLVLIDIDGTKTIFATGKYHWPHGNMPGWWDVGEFYNDALVEQKMRWSYLPLARYYKK